MIPERAFLISSLISELRHFKIFYQFRCYEIIKLLSDIPQRLQNFACYHLVDLQNLSVSCPFLVLVILTFLSQLTVCGAICGSLSKLLIPPLIHTFIKLKNSVIPKMMKILKTVFQESCQRT